MTEFINFPRCPGKPTYAELAENIKAYRYRVEELESERDTQRELIGKSAEAIYGEYHDMRARVETLENIIIEADAVMNEDNVKLPLDAAAFGLGAGLPQLWEEWKSASAKVAMLETALDTKQAVYDKLLVDYMALKIKLGEWTTIAEDATIRATTAEDALKAILEECPNPVLPYGKRVVEIVQEAIAKIGGQG